MPPLKRLNKIKSDENVSLSDLGVWGEELHTTNESARVQNSPWRLALDGQLHASDMYYKHKFYPQIGIV